jgi:hypothetical protein
MVTQMKSGRIKVTVTILLIFGVAGFLVIRIVQDAARSVTRFSAPSPSHDTAATRLKQLAAEFGKDRGLYDARQGLHDYREEFRRDPPMAWVYMGYHTNADGSQDPRGVQLIENTDKSTEGEKQELTKLFIKSYINGFNRGVSLKALGL